MPGLILLTGATGYIGGRLLTLLQKRGIRVRCLSRRPEVLTERMDSTTEVVAGDLIDRDSLDAALAGVDTAYYFVHSMGASRDFEQEDRIAATNFGKAAAAAGVRRVIYLGGVVTPDHTFSQHLRSRKDPGAVLVTVPPQTTYVVAPVGVRSVRLPLAFVA